jgi:hypothetical protein
MVSRRSSARITTKKKVGVLFVTRICDSAVVWFNVAVPTICFKVFARQTRFYLYDSCAHATRTRVRTYATPFAPNKGFF